MNWLGDLCQKEIEATDVVLDMGCGIMQATLDTIPSYPHTRLRCAELIGLDLFDKYLEVIKHKENVVAVKADITRPPIREKSADVVLLLDVLEHFNMSDAQEILSDAERLARRKIIVHTPFLWSDNEGIDSYGLGENALQRHKSLITVEFLRARGFAVKLVTHRRRKRFWKSEKTIFAVKADRRSDCATPIKRLAV